MAGDLVRILTVDDRPDGLMALEAVLSDPGYEVMKASSGREALRLLTLYEFAVILLDVQMPNLDGFQTADIIKKHEKSKDMPIIFITAINKENYHVHRGYDHGAVDYLFKPFDPDILRSKVAIFANLFRMRVKIQEQSLLLLESERREREYRLADLELRNLRRYQSLADAIPHIIWRAKPDGTVDHLNRYWFKYTGLTEEQSKGSGWFSNFHAGDLKSFLARWAEVKASGESFEIECRMRGNDQTDRWHLIRVVPEKGIDNDVISWIGTCTEIHEIKETKEKLSVANNGLERKVRERTQELWLVNESLKRVQKEIIEISEKERSRFGQDLHDGLAQELTAASFIIQSIRNKWGDSFPAKMGKGISETIQLLKNALEKSRRLARNLYPIELERNGLTMALKELAMNKSRIFSVHCTCSFEGMPEVTEDLITQTQLYRIAQEAVQNAIRHAQAKNILITLANLEDKIILKVDDDGIGLLDYQDKIQGMGLRIMHYRAQMIEAELQIESELQKGTRVNCILFHSRPVSQESVPEKETKRDWEPILPQAKS